MSVLSPGEEQIMRDTFRTAMLRCADIIQKITDADVLEAQAVLLASGMTLQQVAKMDRALLAEKHIRACVAVSIERDSK